MRGDLSHKLGVAGLVLATVTLAQHPWPMFRHDPQYTGRNPYVGPASPVEKWRFEMGAKNGMGFLGGTNGL